MPRLARGVGPSLCRLPLPCYPLLGWGGAGGSVPGAAVNVRVTAQNTLHRGQGRTPRVLPAGRPTDQPTDRPTDRSGMQKVCRSGALLRRRRGHLILGVLGERGANSFWFGVGGVAGVQD
eukprot:CAMPEP_0174300632 /NCGR_PEP_ID=MMETSP0809-20121228/58576_1 /TAXON_ID=73025 ORGANISM="Eutreptiella gymnastica-like, Strain CCMP1594" /NCGR_SAMPLE_ID=MMETSP0809 /ASSEMBLY_ACC=CAM_ASM_000658 /LENGTH=119 /DNA_ID=CAMNT_0015406243 /DNA_START=3036 /DNA_END=3395 /DNA_ORIENTATION=+